MLRQLPHGAVAGVEGEEARLLKMFQISCKQYIVPKAYCKCFEIQAKEKDKVSRCFYFSKRFVAKWLDQRGLMWPAILERGESPGDRRILVSGNYQVRGCPGNHFLFHGHSVIDMSLSLP